MSADTLTLALWQTPMAATTAEALQRLNEAAAQARAQGAHGLITPEMALTGYALGAERVAAVAEAANGPLAQAVATIAQRHGLLIVYGYPEHHPGGKPFNAAQAIAPDGARLMNYRKTHRYGELDRTQFSAGNAASQVFAWRGWRLGLLICYDVEFPETVRLLALQGADAVLVPTANMVPFDAVQRVLLPARALENRLCVAYANACGSEAAWQYNGLSTVIDAQGTPIAQTGRHPALLMATLERTAATQQQAGLSERRPDLYAALAAG